MTKAAASVPAGNYTPATTCARTASGQTVSVSAPLAITVSAAALVTGQFDFSDPVQSGLLTLLF